MSRIIRAINIGNKGAVFAVQELLWGLLEKQVVQGLLVPLQAHANEAPAPTLIKNRERLDKANPLAPVLTLNSAKIVGLLLAQSSHKRLAAVMRPCEARTLFELAEQGQIDLNELVTISVDCLGSHQEQDYEQRTVLWGDMIPTQESLRWSRRGQIAPYRFREACQICEEPCFDDADISIGLFGQNIKENILVSVKESLGREIGFNNNDWGRPATQREVLNRQHTIEKLVAQRHRSRARLLDQVQQKASELSDLLALFSSCTLCGECVEACPLSALYEFDMAAYADSTPEYVTARILNLIQRSESCTGCGMCEAACHLGIPLMLITQMMAERAQVKRSVVEAFTAQAAQ